MHFSKWLLPILGLCLMTWVLGCDDGGSSKSSGYSEMMVVTSSSEPGTGDPDDIRAFSGSEFKVIATSSTSVQRQRPSCSGFDDVAVNDIEIGDTIEFDVVDADYSQDPAVVRPSSITAYRAECIAPEVEEDDSCDSCNGSCSGSCGGCTTTNSPCAS